MRDCRRATGITFRRADDLRGRGLDYNHLPGFDRTARELAARHPALRLDRGRESAGGEPDHRPALWELLCAPDPEPPAADSPAVLDAAAAMAGPGSAALAPRRFSEARFAGFLARRSIPWPRLPSGRLALDDGTFRDVARRHPAEIGPIREARHALGQMRLESLAVGPDGRNRAMLSPFRSRTGRNQPSNAAFVFGPSAWLRSLIRPEAGMALAYVDWSQQELGIAAALSGDAAMMEAYTSGDFYLTCARLAGGVPAGATKATHPREREMFKTAALGVLFGLSAVGLARQLGEPEAQGR